MICRYLRRLVGDDLQSLESTQPVSTKGRKRKRAFSKERPSKKHKGKAPVSVENDIEVNPSTEPIVVDPYAGYFPPPPKFYSPSEKIPLIMRMESDNSAPQIQIKNNVNLSHVFLFKFLTKFKKGINLFKFKWLSHGKSILSCY